MKYSRYILGTMELSKAHLRYIISGTKKVCYLYFIYVPILYQIGHISDIFGNPVQNRYTFFVPVKMYQFCTFFWCGASCLDFCTQKFPLIFSSPEHKVLKVSYCDHPVSVVRCQQFIQSTSPPKSLVQFQYNFTQMFP